MLREPILDMLSLQDELNSGVQANWREAGFAWPRAVWVECAEMMEHCGYKWWKAQHFDREQAHLEIIDIWHFGISDLMTRAPDERVAKVLQAIFEEPSRPPPPTLCEAVEQVARVALAEARFGVGEFRSLMVAAELDFAGLYRGYVGKNMLNLLRSRNGYAQGEYRKEWEGREDNQHLAELTATLDWRNSSFRRNLYAALEERYARCRTAHS